MLASLAVTHSPCRMLRVLFTLTEFSDGALSWHIHCQLLEFLLLFLLTQSYLLPCVSIACKCLFPSGLCQSLRVKKRTLLKTSWGSWALRKTGNSEWDNKLTEPLRKAALGRDSGFLVCISPVLRVIAVFPRACFLKGTFLLISGQAAALGTV